MALTAIQQAKIDALKNRDIDTDSDLSASTQIKQQALADVQAQRDAAETEAGTEATIIPDVETTVEEGPSDLDLVNQDLLDLQQEQERANQAEFERQASALEQSLASQREEVVSQAQTAQRQFGRATTAAQSQFATGREGPVAGTAAGLQTGFTAGIQTKFDSVQRQLEGTKASIASQQKALAKARADNDRDAIVSAKEALQSTLLQQKALEEAQAGITTEAEDRVLGMIQDLPSTSWAGMSDEQAIGLFESAGMSPSMAVAWRVGQERLANAQLAKDDIAMQQAQATVAKIETELLRSLEGEATQAAANIQSLNGMVEAGTITQADADAIKVSLGLAEAPETPTEKAKRLLIEAQARGTNLENAELTTEGASHGTDNPIQVFQDVDFGTGQRGQQVTDAEGNNLGVISSGFGSDHSLVSGEKSHNGIDIVFNKGQVPALAGGTIIKKGIAEGTYGGYVWLEDDNGTITQYGHLNVDSLTGLQAGDYIGQGQIFTSQETDPNKWGSSTGPHTDVRVVGQQDNSENQDVANWGYALLDGRATMGNIPQDLRTDVNNFAQQKTAEGYKSNYPVLTETQLGLVNQISDDYRSDPQQRDMLDVKSGFQTVNTLFGSPEKISAATGFDDIAAINAFQRMIDPGATVREGDVALLETSIPWLDRVDPTYKWAQFEKGDKLPPVVRESLSRVANEVYNAKATDFNSTTGETFKARAEAANVPFNLVGSEFTVFSDPVKPTTDQLVQQASADQVSAIEQELAEIEKMLSE